MGRLGRLGLALLIASAESRGDSDSAAWDLEHLTQVAVSSIVESVGIGLDHRAFAPASPLGGFPGVDFGMDIVGVPRPDRFIDALRRAGIRAEIPERFYFPRLNLHKGFPFGIDIGASYLPDGEKYVFGMDVKWGVYLGVEGSTALALRLSKNWISADFLWVETEKVDLLVSRRFGRFLEPYLGAGVQRVNGAVDTSLGSSPAIHVSGTHARTSPHGFIGLPIDVLLGRVAFECDYSLLGLGTFGGKISFLL